MRHARYIGQAKAHLQHLATAGAMNLMRLARWITKDPSHGQGHRTSHVSWLKQPRRDFANSIKYAEERALLLTICRRRQMPMTRPTFARPAARTSSAGSAPTSANSSKRARPTSSGSCVCVRDWPPRAPRKAETFQIALLCAVDSSAVEAFWRKLSSTRDYFPSQAFVRNASESFGLLCEL
ncbi:hypothetical protein JQK88_35120 [Mesorhizobium caraganae]|nr:hypothetical protein [Mesorhizobium caraganae]